MAFKDKGNICAKRFQSAQLLFWMLSEGAVDELKVTKGHFFRARNYFKI